MAMPCSLLAKAYLQLCRRARLCRRSSQCSVLPGCYSYVALPVLLSIFLSLSANVCVCGALPMLPGQYLVICCVCLLLVFGEIFASDLVLTVIFLLAGTAHQVRSDRQNVQQDSMRTFGVGSRSVVC